MKIPLSWVKDFVKVGTSPGRLAQDLQMTGTKVEGLDEVEQDFIFDFEITPNRADCFSVMGIAREIAALYERRLQIPPVFSETNPKRQLSVSFTADGSLSPHYTFGVVLVKVDHSPKWLADRLEKSGIRSINNVVDITNYVMVETGQPMHAFDYDKLKGGLNLRSAEKGEVLTTLDGVSRKLPSDAIVIEDEKGLVDLAGIMGGERCEVDKATQKILLHVPIYHPVKIRRTSQFLNLRTEASGRFEKQLDPAAHRFAFERAIYLLRSIASGESLSEIKSVGYPIAPNKIEVPVSLVSSLLGIKISAAEMEKILLRLGFAVQTGQAGLTLKVMVPTFRTDIKEPVDLCEEVARLYGYDRFPRTLPDGEVPKEEFTVRFGDKVKTLLSLLGCQEIYSSSLLSEADISNLGGSARETLKIANRLILDYEYLRTTLLGGLLAAIKVNESRSKDFALFEIGKVFGKKTADEGLPEQPTMVAAAFVGSTLLESKGILEALLRKLHVKDVRFLQGQAYAPFGKTCASIFVQDTNLGTFGEIDPSVIESLDIKRAISGFELNLELLANFENAPYYQPHPKYPTVRENISMFVPEGLTFADIERSVSETAASNLYGLRLLEDTTIKGRRSVLVEVEYFDPRQTISGTQVSKIREKVLAALKNGGFSLRLD